MLYVPYGSDLITRHESGRKRAGWVGGKDYFCLFTTFTTRYTLLEHNIHTQPWLSLVHALILDTHYLSITFTHNPG